MYLLFILFFISLAGIMVMIGRKLAPIRKGEIAIEENYAHPFIPDIQKIKEITHINIKKYGHVTLVTSLRFYIRGTKILRNKYEEAKIKIKRLGKESHINSEKKEISKFLKIIDRKSVV